VDFIMFTGSTRTGKIVARQASERLIGCSLELGGKNSLIVLDDADLNRAVDGLVRGAFVGAGQVCVSIERAHIPERRFDEFCEKLKVRIGQMKLSSELTYGVDMGSLTLASQLEAVQAHVRDAVAKGARVLAGGRGRPDLGPLFYEPTVLAEVTPAMRVYAEETFGPLVSLYPYRSEDEAIGRINDTRYGLNASVWSGSTRRAVSVAKRIRAGSVNINESYAATWTATASPVGGMGESGSGRRHGAEGILKYTEAQTIAVNRGPALGPPSWVTESSYARQLGRLLKWIRHVPGLR
jgi:succinate-semialdehyde dehydrogenase/glutarate-semialdehyde dehydrogenase